MLILFICTSNEWLLRLLYFYFIGILGLVFVAIGAVINYGMKLYRLENEDKMLQQASTESSSTAFTLSVDQVTQLEQELVLHQRGGAPTSQVQVRPSKPTVSHKRSTII